MSGGTVDSAAPSLKHRLVRQLVAVQAAIQVVVVAVLFCSGQLVDFESVENTVDILQGAVARDATGTLVLRRTPALEALRAQVPDLWFSISDRQGQRLAEGVVPLAFARIGDALAAVGQARLGWNIGDPPRPTARLRTVDTAAGWVQVLTGPSSPFTWRNLGLSVLLVGLKIVLPIMLMTLLATLLATHLVVRRTTAGLSEAAAQAGRIDITRRGVRLPLADVPREVALLVKAVNDALGRLDDGYERHQRFLADAAHELRTPVAILTTRLETLPASAERSRLLEDAARLSVLAGQLLDLQRLDQAGGSGFQPIDLAGLARGVTADMAPLAIAAGYDIAFDEDITFDGQKVPGDRLALERALTNLLQNAIEHGGRRGIITVQLATPWAIDVVDQGPGIPADEQEHIFKPFHRVQRGEPTPGQGAGLGLNLVRQIMHLHGGDVTVADETGGGSRFRLVFPPGPAPGASLMEGQA